jgi:CxxC motif-containing protein (DUF1111 family)
MRRVVSLCALLAGCGAGRQLELDEGEWLVGGDTTNQLLLGRNAFLLPAATLNEDDELQFYSGNSFFNAAWVEAPSTTAARDGLGPFFNARSCSGCHFRDGRGRPPESGEAPFVGLLLRLSVDGEPEPTYGAQLQDQALPDFEPEALPTIVWDPIEGRFDDGTPYELLDPTYTIDADLHPDTRISPRVAPQMIGLGLLEAIPRADLEALADPDDADGDGISGRLQKHGDDIGRFGWKGDAIDLAAQVGGAFAGDMGLTSPEVPFDDCTEAQVQCLEHPNGGEPEVAPDLFDKVVLYSAAIAPPVRRRADQVLAGKTLFHELACASCHVPSFTTGPARLEGLDGQRIWPYTDLLLHDMGPGLADDTVVGVASGQEWQTPPLWGIGLLDDVSNHTRLLHDGRARNVEEAILWHGGEAEDARDRYLALSADERQALLDFVEDL